MIKTKMIANGVVSAVLMAIATASVPAYAQSETLDLIKKRGEFRVGYRTDASPLSYENADGDPAGYSVDLCKRIATAVKSHLDRDDIKTTFVPVTSENRIKSVTNGDIDIECGATTMTMGRQKDVDFTLMTFVTGGSILSLADSGISGLSDLAGKKVSVVKNTTTSTKLRAYLKDNLIDANIVEVEDREHGMKQLNDGAVGAFASDQIVLIGQIIEALDPKSYKLSDETYSYEPYAFMVRRNDSEFRLVANTALTQIIRKGQHVPIYNKWIGRIGVQPSPVLLAMYQLNDLPE